ncbi:MAG: hypothetical protein WDW36_006426 [Sanguina aurantia]
MASSGLFKQQMVNRVLPQSGPTAQRVRTALHRHGRNVVPSASKKGDLLLSADTVSKTFDGEKELFSGLTFTVGAGDKLAVVGPNGCGKSTLLKVIAGLEQHDSGWLSRTKGAKIGYLPQDPPLPPGKTVLQAVLSGDSDMAKACIAYQDALASATGDSLSKELAAAIEKMDALNAWEVDAEAKRVLDAVGILAISNSLCEKLSGGQRKRVALAAALLGKPDLLVLDEPTNHMDVSMIDFLEKELAGQATALVLVSHDRYFMENVCDRMLELDRGKCFMHPFGGANSYDAFKEAREFRRKTQANAALDARTLMRREAEWMAKQPRGRQAKQQARQTSFFELKEKTKDMPTADLKVDFASTGMARQGNKVVKLENISYAVAGKTILTNFTYEFTPGERLGIVGPNGAGKSTLLDLIAGVRLPGSGARELGETARIGYFTQYPPPVRAEMRIIDYIREIADSRKISVASAAEVLDTPEVLLERLGFMRPRQFQKVGSLSGGERRRLHLCSVLIERPNVLILDEPTNDLDLQTVEVVEEVLRGFKGLLLVVSHDRAFMDNVSDQLLVLKGDGGVRLFDGCYSEYLEDLQNQKDILAMAKSAELELARGGTGSIKAGSSGGGTSSLKAAAKAPPPPKARKMGFNEQEEYKKLGKEIEKLNKKIDALNAKVTALSSDPSAFAEITRLSMEMGTMQESSDTKSERWLELAEIAGDI